MYINNSYIKSSIKGIILATFLQIESIVSIYTSTLTSNKYQYIVIIISAVLVYVGTARDTIKRFFLNVLIMLIVFIIVMILFDFTGIEDYLYYTKNTELTEYSLGHGFMCAVFLWNICSGICIGITLGIIRILFHKKTDVKER